MQQYLNNSDKKNEIRLLLQHPTYKDKIILIVEGKTDIKLFRNLIKQKNIIIDSFSGKDSLVKLMQDLHVELPERIIAICDADHDHITNEASLRKRYSVYVTDYHDAEIMMLNSPAIESFIDEYSSHANLNKLRTSLLQNVFNTAYEIGLLRLANYRHKLNLKFKNLDYSQFININQSDIKIDIDKLINQILTRSTNKKPKTNHELLIKLMEGYRKQSICIHQLCNGHDTTSIIAEVYRTVWASEHRNMDRQKVETALRVSYQKNYFLDTDLYKQLKILNFLNLSIA